MNNIDKKTIIGVSVFFALIIVIIMLLMPIDHKMREKEEFGKLAIAAETDDRARYIIDNISDYPQELIEDYMDGGTDLEFVYGYPFYKDSYATMSFTDEEINCGDEIPRLYMDDKRWGYENNYYLKDYGCMHLCTTMAYLYFYNSPAIDPVKIMNYTISNNLAGENGVYTDSIADVLAAYGMTAEEHNFDENHGGEGEVTAEELIELINRDDVIVIGAMGGGFGGHAVIFREYDGEYFYLNDPRGAEESEIAYPAETIIFTTARYYVVTKAE
ncbi:MAG: hypothetical protein J6K17_13495 [Oscillospiraceae bacterium]|nr:hypothetical protein [Oscillospiraceae bacterium]